MQKAYELAEKIVNDVNKHCEEYKLPDGKFVPSEDMVSSLDDIVKSGLILHNYLVEKKLYEGKPVITADILAFSKYTDKLKMNEKNAKKLNVKDALQLWNEVMIVSANLACDLLDFRDNLN